MQPYLPFMEGVTKQCSNKLLGRKAPELTAPDPQMRGKRDILGKHGRTGRETNEVVGDVDLLQTRCEHPSHRATVEYAQSLPPRHNHYEY